MNINRRRTGVIVGGLCLVFTFPLMVGPACDGGGNGNGNGDGDLPVLDRIDLNVVKLEVEATTQRGPAVGDGVLAFDAQGGALLAWLFAGETVAREVPAPARMTHDRSAFAFASRNLVVRDRFSGSLYVFDPDSEEVADIPSASINMGGMGGPNLWEADGDLVATVNSVVTTQDGAGKLVKMADVSNVGAFVVTPFDVNPANTPNAIALDAQAGTVVVRSGDTFYVYDVDEPTNAPTEFTRSSLQGGAGSDDIQVAADYVAFFDDEDNFTLLDMATGTFAQPTRNPGRPNRGLGLNTDRFAYFALQTADDGGPVSQANRALVGATDDLVDLIDPAGAFINGENDWDGRVGFGATLSVSPNGRYVFVAGETAVGVDEEERLYLSIDGDGFQVVEDPDDELNALRAAGVAASDDLVAFLIPEDLDGVTSNVSVGYATLPPE